MTAIKAHVLSALTAIVAVVASVGFINESTESNIVIVGGFILAGIFQLLNYLHVKLGTGSPAELKAVTAAPSVVSKAEPPAPPAK